MLYNSDTANKTIKNLQAEIDLILNNENRNRTYTCGVSETPHAPEYSFSNTQERLTRLRGKIAKLRHAVNRFNLTTKIELLPLTGSEEDVLNTLASALEMPSIRSRPATTPDAMLIQNAVKILMRIDASGISDDVYTTISTLYGLISNWHDSIRKYYLPMFEKIEPADNEEAEENKAISRWFLEYLNQDSGLFAATTDIRESIARLEMEKGAVTVDEALHRMSVLHREKQRLYEMIQIPEMTRARGYGGREADFVYRNFDSCEVEREYDRVSQALMGLQQSINIVNLMKTFEVDI